MKTQLVLTMECISDIALDNDVYKGMAGRLEELLTNAFKEYGLAWGKTEAEAHRTWKFPYWLFKYRSYSEAHEILEPHRSDPWTNNLLIVLAIIYPDKHKETMSKKQEHYVNLYRLVHDTNEGLLTTEIKAMTEQQLDEAISNLFFRAQQQNKPYSLSKEVK
jgi:hypothetical protein